MAVTKADKDVERQQLESAFRGAESVILVDFRGLDVPYGHGVAPSGPRRARVIPRGEEHGCATGAQGQRVRGAVGAVRRYDRGGVFGTPIRYRSPRRWRRLPRPHPHSKSKRRLSRVGITHRHRWLTWPRCPVRRSCTRSCWPWCRRRWCSWSAVLTALPRDLVSILRQLEVKPEDRMIRGGPGGPPREPAREENERWLM